MIATIDELTDLSIEDYEQLIRFKKEVIRQLSDTRSMIYHSKIIRAYIKQFIPE